jgi:hypothetical protein
MAKDISGKVHKTIQDAAKSNVYIRLTQLPVESLYVTKLLAEASAAGNLQQVIPKDVLIMLEILIITHWINYNLTDLETLISRYLDELRSQKSLF